MSTVKVSRKNQIAVPAAARRRLGIKPGDHLRVEVVGQKLILQQEPPDRRELPEPLRRLMNIAPEIWQGVDPQTYIDELRDEWSDREH